MRIGDAAHEVDSAPHVLRHWESVGVIRPERDPSGRRAYGPQDIVKLRIVRACQRLGISLSDIRTVIRGTRPERKAVVEQQLAWIEEQRRQLDAAEEFLSHVVNCSAADVTRCDGWRRYAGLPPLHEHHAGENRP
ncbi:MerR family transcriptional regulator [Microbacterium sp. LMI1-1-1.1]|uniref:MerR family transcriptional regulator n=1 Tax=Microbacterium sp. LMI1-1-1.1 TaxID=3135223 RepID=UPI0034666CBE